jgi:multidrug efflux pump subunit AcrA (membrane-fusion protein)
VIPALYIAGYASTVAKIIDARRRRAPTAGRFLTQLLGAALHPGGASRAILWRRSGDASWQLAAEMPPHDHEDSNFINQRQPLLTGMSTERQPHFLNNPNGSHGNRSSNGVTELLIPIHHLGQAIGVLETTNRRDGPDQVPRDVVQFCAMLCEITADFLAQSELLQLRRLKIAWQKWDQFSHQLWQSQELNSVCSTIANDGRLLAECDRICILIRRGRSYRLTSVSGVERVEPRSSATRLLESLGKFAAQAGKPIWTDALPGKVTDERRPGSDDELQRYLGDLGATGMGVVPIEADSDRKNRLPPMAMIVFNQFKPIADQAAWRSRGELLANRASPALRVALERSEIPWLSQWQQMRRLPWAIARPSSLVVLLLIAGTIAALALVPAEFTIAASGELWPSQRREVFASTSAIVEEILVSNGDDVTVDQPLIVLRDPELEVDSPRIIGEIATVGERLKGVQIARFTAGNNTEAVSRARQLATDEEELKERLRTLELQRLLIEERTAGLKLRSPISGKVLTWDVAQHLLARPVERGQSLLSIGETSGLWIIDARIADKDAGHVLRARKERDPKLAVEFMLASEPERSFRGQIEEMSPSSEFDDASRSLVRLVVSVDPGQIEQPRAGASVLCKIHCGQKPFGYVWLRDLIDAIRLRVLF